MGKILKIIFVYFVTACACIFLNAQMSFAGYLGSGTLPTDMTPTVSDEGGTENVLYKNDTIMLENTVLDNAITPVEPELAKKEEKEETEAVPRPGSVFGIGLDVGFAAFFSNYLKMYYIPISYMFLEKFTASVNIPYISRTIKNLGTEYSASGIGDMRVGISYSWIIPMILAGITNFKVSLPTGDENASDSGFSVPLGTGGYSFSLMQAVSKMIDPVRLFGNIGIVYFLESSYKTGGIKITEEKGTVFSFMFGAEYWLIAQLAFLLKTNYVYITEGQFKYSGVGWSDLNDALQTSDLIGGLRYKILADILYANLLFVLPIYTKHDSGAVNPQDRKWGINFALTGLL